MDHDIQFAPLAWDNMRAFLETERRKINRDVDQDVRYMTYSLFCQERVEGLYLNGELVGFARWDVKVGHLSNLYVSPTARGHGIARRFLRERPIRILYVMAHNHQAKKLYTSMGFIASPAAVPFREVMVRQQGLFFAA